MFKTDSRCGIIKTSMKVKRALISVSDKTGLEGFVRSLAKFGVEILSTGGTAKAIESFGVAVREVSDYTGFPEMMNGRVKTLHPKIHAGLLARRDKTSHMEEAKKHDIGMIDMVVVNLYPFEKVAAKEGVPEEEAVENIDIGGPSMLRSAAKNYKAVACVCNPTRYESVIKELEASGGSLSEPTLRSLAVDVFKRTSAYDSAIYNYLGKRSEDRGQRTEGFPEDLTLGFKKVQDLRYGENPHQSAAFYADRDAREAGVATARQLHGKELSFNNILDLDAATELAQEFSDPAAIVIKHTNACGAATAKTQSQAYINALACDRLSAFGSVIGFNRTVEAKTARTIMKEADFVECIIAPGFEKDALSVLKTKKNLRILELPALKEKKAKTKTLKKVTGGLLLQDADTADLKDLKVVTKKKPTAAELKSLAFGWKVVKHIKSNAIVLTNGTVTAGIGAGQMSRVDSVIIASRKAGSKTKAACLASDAFFPKKDSIEAAHKKGIKAIIQPGGSIRDEEVIRACDKHGIAMVFTGIRHFKH